MNYDLAICEIVARTAKDLAVAARNADDDHPFDILGVLGKAMIPRTKQLMVDVLREMVESLATVADDPKKKHDNFLAEMTRQLAVTDCVNVLQQVFTEGTARPTPEQVKMLQEKVK
jgi:hypothetical protein